MPQATPKRAGRAPRPGSRFPEQVLADNVRAYRQLRRLSQDELGERMAALGHGWSGGVVGFVERGDRNVTVGELLGLCLVLRVAPTDLLDPFGVGGMDVSHIDVGSDGPMDPVAAQKWMAGEVVCQAKEERGRMLLRFSPGRHAKSDVMARNLNTLQERAEQRRAKR